MNARQAAKLAAKKIEELEHFNGMCVRDIKTYNEVVLTLIAGGDPCPWCNDQEDCPLISQGHGCKDWFLKVNLGMGDDEKNDREGTDNESESVPVQGVTGRA